jgi:probable rRNA maturation factor
MELDLSLDASGVDIDGPHDGSLLSNATWAPVLLQWVEHVRSNPDLSCPSVVRLAPEVSLGLRFTDDAGIAELNSQWRQRSGPTDVLSFAALDNTPNWLEGAAVELGDIIVSLDTAHRQAADHDHSLRYELHWLISHGLLHLLGWDHPDERSLSAMLALQEHLLDITGNVLPKDKGPRAFGDRVSPDAYIDEKASLHQTSTS